MRMNPGVMLLVATAVVCSIAAAIGAKVWLRHSAIQNCLNMLESESNCYSPVVGSNHFEQLCWELKRDVRLEVSPLQNCCDKVGWEKLDVAGYFEFGVNEIVVLSSIPNLTSLTVPSLSTEAARELHRLKELQEVYFWPSMDCRQLAELSLVPGVIAIGFEEATHMDEILPRVCTSCPNLEWLNLSKSDVTDDGLKQLPNLKRLQVLYVDDTEVGCIGMNALTECRSLTFVSAERSNCRKMNSVLANARFKVRLESP